MICTALGVKFNIFRFFPMPLTMASGFFCFRIFLKRFFSVRLANSRWMCYKKENKYSLLLRIYVCFFGGASVWKERIYAVI